MKVGVRTPSVSKRVKARTTGKLKRKAKKAVNPFYGKKGMGMIKNPKRAVYNKVYKKTTVSVDDIIKAGSGSSKGKKKSTKASKRVASNAKGFASATASNVPKQKTTFFEKMSIFGGIGFISIILGIICLFSSVSSGLTYIGIGIVMIIIASTVQKKIDKKQEEAEGTTKEENPIEPYDEIQSVSSEESSLDKIDIDISYDTDQTE